MAATHSTGTAVRPVDLALQVEIGADADTGSPWLIADTGAGYEETTPGKLRAHVQQMRRQLEDAERLADQYEAIAGLRTLLDERDIELTEIDVADFPPRMRDGFIGWTALVSGRRHLVFPLGQDPVLRLSIARKLVARGESA
ncbi:hypothetical protein AB0O20_06520 [Streptomyces kronopolitis]|uniref:hypothetical protein n=1 Tax=Streptomyces kronopolitis TaxID=1612435 RepID=UPI003425AB43